MKFRLGCSSPTSRCAFWGTAIMLAALALRSQRSADPVGLDSSAGLRSAPLTHAASQTAGSVGEIQIHEITNPKANPVEQWMLASPRRAQLMSPEALAGYEPVINALGLSQSQGHRLRQLIVERAESASDADQLGKECRLSPEQTLLLRNDAEAAFDEQLKGLVGTANFQVVREMLELDPQLAEIADLVGRKLTRLGQPLAADQTLQLARLFKMAYVNNPMDHPAQITGSGLDRLMLVRASAILTSEQIDALR